MALFALVLFASFLFENDNLFTAAVADDRRRNFAAADRGLRTFARHQRFELDLVAFLALEAGNTYELAFRDGELLAAAPDNCVTHIVEFSNMPAATI